MDVGVVAEKCVIACSNHYTFLQARRPFSSPLCMYAYENDTSSRGLSLNLEQSIKEGALHLVEEHGKMSNSPQRCAA